MRRSLARLGLKAIQKKGIPRVKYPNGCKSATWDGQRGGQFIKWADERCSGELVKGSIPQGGKTLGEGRQPVGLQKKEQKKGGGGKDFMFGE